MLHQLRLTCFVFSSLLLFTIFSEASAFASSRSSLSSFFSNASKFGKWNQFSGTSTRLEAVKSLDPKVKATLRGKMDDYTKNRCAKCFGLNELPPRDAIDIFRNSYLFRNSHEKVVEAMKCVDLPLSDRLKFLAGNCW